MTEPIKLPTQQLKDSEALGRMVDGLVERYKAGDIRSGFVLFFDKSNLPHMSVACTTLSDESYAIALLQERLMRLLRVE
jgi:hypothetical protein